MPEKARFYIAVKEPASNLSLQAQISRPKLGSSFGALLINIELRSQKSGST
ncbi:hypothetical protein Sbal625DRAFT_2266 [Shewanella baltica OS625]|nr:hypothetical protein Sbal678_1119 [Shewanella baltica OS678]EHC05675.1 hypothetical protein Sbal625DRAFT_2266 [Shewanella baltica OS625]SUI77643.1 Uncharacterised protein [Shewanella baltica]